jgi:hypothetical protein
MRDMNPEEAAVRRVDAKAARSNERLARRYSDSSVAARRNLDARAQYLQSRAMAPKTVRGGASHAR